MTQSSHVRKPIGLLALKEFGLLRSVWSLLTTAERRSALVIVVYLVIGTVLEVISVAALVPLVQVLTQSNLRSRYPLLDQMFPKSSDEFIVTVILLAVVFLFLLKEIFLGFSLWMQRGFVARLEYRYQTELFNQYTRQVYEFHLANNSSLLSRNILNSTNYVYNVLDPIFILLTDGFVTIALCVALVVIEPIAMFTTIFAVGVVAASFHGFSRRRIERWGLERQSQDGLKLLQMNETYGGMKDLIVTGRGDYFRERFSSTVTNLSQINRKFTTLLGVPRLYLELMAVAGLAVLVISMLALGRNSESLLSLLALFAGGAFRLMPAVNRITYAFQSLRMGRPIVAVHQADMLNAGSNTPVVIRNQGVSFERVICFENVTYSYPDSNRNAIDGVNFEINKGSEVGVIGSTGSGKSTFVDILLGLLKPTSGKVTVDGIDIATNTRGWQNLVGYVPQTIFLIDSSIRANVAFGIQPHDVDDDRVERALRLAQLSEFVNDLPEGVNQLVGERGVRLSGGQRQRIGIARALYLDPPVLVFDEATSALDINTEQEVMNSLNHLRNNKTILIVTHRTTAIEHCDKIIVIENGKVVLR